MDFRDVPWYVWAGGALVALVLVSAGRSRGVSIGSVTTVPTDPNVANMETSRQSAVASLAGDFFSLHAERGGQDAAVTATRVQSARDVDLGRLQATIQMGINDVIVKQAEYAYQAERSRNKKGIFDTIVGGVVGIVDAVIPG